MYHVVLTYRVTKGVVLRCSLRGQKLGILPLQTFHNRCNTFAILYLPNCQFFASLFAILSEVDEQCVVALAEGESMDVSERCHRYFMPEPRGSLLGSPGVPVELPMGSRAEETQQLLH